MVGQTHITRTLQNALAGDQLAHAYLFVGPRGTGKTTTARILAKALFCECGAPTSEPDGSCETCKAIAEGNHPDVIELDAASRTGVENVRDEIISRVHYAPAQGKYKVYIIDEVHMLSTGAFNAMLKTLEEPPSHVIFVLCTTHPQKIPQTIKSRCQQFDFHPISIEDITARLGYIAQSEGVQIDPAALPMIAKFADGGMRDAITALEQLISFAGEEITVDDVEGMLGEIDSQSLATLATSVATRDVVATLQWVQAQVEVGADLVEITRSLQEYLRDMYVLSVLGVSAGIIDRTNDEIENLGNVGKQFIGPEHIARSLDLLDEAMSSMRRSTNPRLILEMVLIRATRPEGDISLEALAQRIESLEQGRTGAVVPISMAAEPASQRPIDPASPVPATTTPTSAPAPTPATDGGVADPMRAEQLWRITLTRIRETSPSRYPLYVDTSATFDDEGMFTIIYDANQVFRMKQAGQRENLVMLTQALHEAAATNFNVKLKAGDEIIYAPVSAIDTASSDDDETEEPEAPQVMTTPAPVIEVPSAKENMIADETAHDAVSSEIPFELQMDSSVTLTEAQTKAAALEEDQELMGKLDEWGATVIDQQDQ